MPDLFTRPLEVWRPSSTGDGSGGEDESLVKVEGDRLLAKVDQPAARDQLVAGQAGAKLTHSIYFDGVVDVRRGDELRDPAPGTDVFTVIAVVRPSDPVYTKATSELIQSEES